MEAQDNKKQEIKVTCKWCGELLPLNHTGPCPKCGKKGCNILITHRKTIVIKDSVEWESRREFFEENPKIKWIIVAITIGSPFLGLFLRGLIGIIIGLVISIVSYILGPYAIIKVREITKGKA